MSKVVEGGKVIYDESEMVCVFCDGLFDPSSPGPTVAIAVDMSCFVRLCNDSWVLRACHAMQCCVARYYAIECYVLVCYVFLCYAMQCNALSFSYLANESVHIKKATCPTRVTWSYSV